MSNKSKSLMMKINGYQGASKNRSELRDRKIR